MVASNRIRSMCARRPAAPHWGCIDYKSSDRSVNEKAWPDRRRTPCPPSRTCTRADLDPRFGDPRAAASTGSTSTGSVIRARFVEPFYGRRQLSGLRTRLILRIQDSPHSRHIPPQAPAIGNDFKNLAPEYAPQSQQNSPSPTLENPFPILKFLSILEKHRC
ncbi:hypothetical protein [Ralstonia pseudosolanacearum]